VFAFCGRCGASIAPSSAPLDAGDHYSTRAERRQLTVVFCDLVGSTDLSTQLDPEEFNDLTREYERVCAEVIERHEGRIARFVGDGILVYFGYPLSHEDDPKRAVRAALDIVAAISALGQSLGRALHVRVAVHTGLVVVGRLGGAANPDPLAVSGETPNVAARLQAFAEPDTVVTSAATYHLIQGFFLCRSLGTPALKGLSAPIEVYEILEPTGIETRFERAVASGLTPFVSREDEVGVLLERWEQAKALQGQVVMLRGEAGIGKSRLVRALVERTAGEPLWELSCRCSPYYQNSALYPAIDCLQRMLRYDRNDDADTKLAKLEEMLAQFAIDPGQMIPLFASLLSLPPDDRYPGWPMSPQRQKQKTFEAIVELLMRAAERGPVRLIVEDLHWADSSTLDLIDLLIERLSGARLLLILPFRPEFVAPWPHQAHITDLTLGRLSRAPTERMIQSVAGGKTLPAEVVEEIIEKTEGVPLFVEELTRMVLESPLLEERADRYLPTSALPSLTIPSTLHDSLMARLDRLGTAKEVAQLCATIGKDFSYELLRAVSPLDETKLSGSLNRLVDAELLEQDTTQNRLRYSFRHALIRDAAYDSLLHSQRRLYHRKVAEVLQDRFSETVGARPELLAHHFTEAGLIEQAIPYWQGAGQRALERSAGKEAMSHLSKGLELLSLMPESPQRLQQEFALRITLGVPLMLTKGFAAPEVEQLYSRARNLYQQIPESPQLFPMLFGLWAFYSVRADYRTARDLCSQLLTLAQSAKDPELLLEAHAACGNTTSFLGELVAAREHLEQAITLYDPKKHGAHAYIYPQDPGVHSLSYATLTLWLMGYPDQARKRSLEALALGQKLSHPFSLAFAMIHVLYIHRFSGEVNATQERADELLKLAAQYEFPIPLAVGMAHRGWALVEQGRKEEGIGEIRQGIESWRATGSTLFFQPFLLGMLAEALGKAGLPEEGLTSVTEALSIANATGERFWEAELYRLKGESILQCEDQASRSTTLAEAAESFRTAIDIAQRQAAKSLELRATISLSRLWRRQGKHVPARRMLAGICGWFTEGSDSHELEEARLLLQEVS
jgi:TOMM system kinase/cyclase fusion protein